MVGGFTGQHWEVWEDTDHNMTPDPGRKAPSFAPSSGELLSGLLARVDRGEVGRAFSALNNLISLEDGGRSQKI